VHADAAGAADPPSVPAELDAASKAWTDLASLREEQQRSGSNPRKRRAAPPPVAAAAARGMHVRPLRAAPPPPPSSHVDGHLEHLAHARRMREAGGVARGRQRPDSRSPSPPPARVEAAAGARASGFRIPKRQPADTTPSAASLDPVKP
jgi:hypothetical protein